MHIGWGNIPHFCFLFFLYLCHDFAVFISRNDAVANYTIYQREQPGVTTHNTTGRHFKPPTINVFITSYTERQWYEHVQRMEEGRLPKEVMKCRPPGRRKRGRPKLTWAEGIKGLMGEKRSVEEDWNDRHN
jgi:hypothetical protein